MPAIAAMPVGKKSIENVLQMLQVFKMSTWLSVTHLPNKTQSLTNGGTEIHRPVTENQVLKMSTSFFVPSQGLLKIRCRHPALDFTRNRISWSFWPTEKAGRAVHSRTACPEQECRGTGRQWRPQKAGRYFEAPTEPTGETAAL